MILDLFYIKQIFLLRMEIFECSIVNLILCDGCIGMYLVAYLLQTSFIL